MLLGAPTFVRLVWPLGANYSEIITKVQNFSFVKMQLKISSAKRWPFCPGGWVNTVRILADVTIPRCNFQTYYGSILYQKWYSNSFYPGLLLIVSLTRSAWVQVMGCCHLAKKPITPTNHKDHLMVSLGILLLRWIYSLCAKFYRGNIYIYILCHSSTLIWHRYLKSFLKLEKDLHIPYSQYHGCWCPGDVRSQGISSHDTDLVKLR